MKTPSRKTGIRTSQAPNGLLHAVVLAACIGSPAFAGHLRAQIQQSPGGAWSADVGAGLGIPGSVISETVAVGFAGAVGLATALGRHVGVRADVAIAFEPGKDLTNTFGPGGVPLSRGPDVTLIHYTVGLSFLPLAPTTTPWWMSTTILLGGTSTTGSGGSIDAGPWLTAGVGARIGRRLSPRVGVWLGARAYVFAVGRSGDAAIDSNIPILAGIRMGL